MKLKFPLIAAFVCLLSLTACGGGSSSSTPAPSANQPTELAVKDVVVGNGDTATAGKIATVTYTGWLYSSTATDFHGTKFDSGSFAYTVGSNGVITGFDQGVTGMKVGGKRSIIVPASLGYGGVTNGAIPANSALVFDVELTKVQ